MHRSCLPARSAGWCSTTCRMPGCSPAPPSWWPAACTSCDARGWPGATPPDGQFAGTDQFAGAASRGRPTAVNTVPSDTKIGGAHVSTPVTNEHLVCRLQHEKKNMEHYDSTTV